MDEETRRRCLEPFFTTKGEQGTGLGLSMVCGIAQRHRAEVEIESGRGKGTIVRLCFPVAKAETLQPVPLASQPPAPAPLRILLVDDDPRLLKILCEILEGEGHSVAAAGDGLAGVNLFRKAQGDAKPFAVVISDLGMPRMDGRKVAASIKQASPSTPVILLTGWGRPAVESETPPHVDRVLGKPPKLRELRDALAACCPSR
jgi:CheY-like chemotaxis protein